MIASNIKTKRLENRIDSLNIIRRIILLKKNLILKSFISLILTKKIMHISIILRASITKLGSITRGIGTDLSNKLLHSSILISNCFLCPCINVCSLQLGLSRKHRSKHLHKSSISGGINLAFSSSRGNAGSGSTGGNGSAVTSHSTKHRIKTSSLKIANLTLMRSIAHVFLPRTAFSGLLSVELHSQGILTLLPITLLSGQLCAPGGVF